MAILAYPLQQLPLCSLLLRQYSTRGGESLLHAPIAALPQSINVR